MEKNIVWVNKIEGWKTIEEIVESIDYLHSCLLEIHNEDFSRMEEMESEIEELEGRVEDLKYDCKNCENELDDKIMIIEELEDELAEMEDQKLSLENRVEDLEAENENLEYHIEEMRGRR